MGISGMDAMDGIRNLARRAGIGPGGVKAFFESGGHNG